VTSPRSVGVLGGVAFAALGILGFVPGVTAHYGELHLAHSSQAQLFGVFRVSILLNLIHLLVGAIGIVVVARTSTIAFASLALWLVGAAAGAWLSLDLADNWLHLVLGVALLGLGSATRATRREAVA
jgi:Domain of unknown function (DUF4383)